MKTFILLGLIAFSLSLSAFAEDLAGCRPQLEKALCYSAPVEHWAHSPSDLKGAIRRFQERDCRLVPAKLKETLISVYEKYPKEIQSAFCEMKRVFIVSGDVSYGALADYYFDVSTVKSTPGQRGPRFSGTPTGFILEVSEKNRFKGESAPAYFTRVLQARFGNVGPDKSRLPVAEYQDPFGEHGALATTIVHEIGHMLGRAQKVTSTYFLPLSEGNWSKLSFRLEDGDYKLLHASAHYRESMPYKLLSEDDVPATLNLFRKTGIATLYGGTSPQEDLAEFFMLSYYGNLKWKIQGKVVFDLPTELSKNVAFKTKREIIRKLMVLPVPFSLKNRGTVSGDIGPM